MLIPEKVNSFNVYGGPAALQLVGAATVELPTLQTMTETISGAGLAGEYESPTPGHFSSLTVKLQFRTLTLQAIALLAPTQQVLDCRASVQTQDSLTRAIGSSAWRVECSGQVKMFNAGRLESGKLMGAELDLEIATLRVKENGVPLLELDKFNMIYRVLGVDYLQKIRQDVGGV